MSPVQRFGKRRLAAAATASVLALLLIAALATNVFAVRGLGLFQLDGNAFTEPQPPSPYNGEDWDVIWNGTTNSEAHLFYTDDVGTFDDAFTTGGSKDVNNIDRWRWTRTPVLDKNDLAHAFAAVYPSAGDTVIYFGADRLSFSGDSQIGFWFFQNDIRRICADPAIDPAVCEDGSFEGLHRVGDLLIVSDFTNGGKISTINVFEWNPDHPDAVKNLRPLATGLSCQDAGDNDPLCAIVNWEEVDSPWPYTPKSGTDGKFPPGTFFEGGINLNQALPDGFDGCFSSFLAEGRSSTSTEAQLKDFALGKFDFCSVKVEKTGDALSKATDKVTYNIKITNDGARTLYLQSFADSLVPTVVVPAACNTLAPDAFCEFSYEYTVLATDPDPLKNTASVIYDSKSDKTGSEVTDSDDHSVNLFQPSVTIDKTGDTLSKVGDDVNYTITVDNTSSNDSPNLVCTISDPMLGVNQQVNLAWNASNYVINKSYTVPAGAPDPLPNTATVTCSPEGFPNVLTASDGHSVNLFQPAIELTKTGDALSKIGDKVNYKITLENNSSADTPNLTCTVTDAKAGVNETFSIASGLDKVIEVKDFVIPANATDPFVNTASVNCSPAGFPNVYTDSARWETNLFQPAIELTKTGDALSKIGDKVDYKITLENNSSADTPNLTCTVTDAKVAVNETFSIASGLDKVIEVKDFVIPANAADPFVNEASVTCSPTGFPNVYTDSAKWETNLFQPAIELTKMGDMLSKIGDKVNYKVTLENNSSADTPNLTCTVTDPVVGLTATFSVVSGADHVINVNDFVIPANATDPFVNTASVTCSPAGFPNVYTDSAKWETNLFQPAIELTKTGDALSKIGDKVNYKITLENNSSADTPDLVCTVTDPVVGIAAATFSVASGADHVINVNDFVIPANATDPFVNEASVTCSPTGFPNVYTDSAKWETNLFQPSVTIDKTVAEKYSKAGHDVHYTITVDNTSSSDSPDLVCKIVDTMLGIDKSVTLPANAANYVINATHAVLAGDPDPLPNTATVTCSPTGFPNVLAASDSASVDLLHPGIELSKSCVAEPVVAGANANFKIVFKNTGDVELMVKFDEDVTGAGCPANKDAAVEVAAGATLECMATKVADTGVSESWVTNEVNVLATLPAKYELDNEYRAKASDSCDIYAVKSGYKWNDLNGDGVWDGRGGAMGEPALSGWKIHFYEWVAGAWGATPVEVTTGADGAYKYDMVKPGAKYAVCEVMEPGFEQSFPNVTLPAAGYLDCSQFGAGYGPIGYEIQLASGVIHLENNFGNWEPTGCTYTQGYWKNHAGKGPQEMDPAWTKLLGPSGPDTMFFDSGMTWHTVFTTPPSKGEAWYILAHQYMAAKLNIANGSGGTAVLGNAISRAEYLLNNWDGNPNPLGIPKESQDRAEALMIAELLDSYNNGEIGPGHCSEEATPSYFGQ